MPQPFILPGPDRDQRSGTLNLMSTLDYDPTARPATTPLDVGGYVVYRKPMLRTPLTVYMVMLGDTVAGSLVSRPSPADCKAIVGKYERENRARLEAERKAAAEREAREATQRARRAARQTAKEGVTA